MPTLYTPLTLEDPLLGTLRRKCTGVYALAAPMRLSPLGGDFEIVLDLLDGDRDSADNGTVVTESHRRRLRWLEGHAADLAGPLQQAVAGFYRENRELYWTEYARHYDPDRATALVPPIGADEEIWRLIRPHLVWLEMPGMEVDTHLNFDARWDDEHGVAVNLLDGRIVSVTQQGV